MIILGINIKLSILKVKLEYAKLKVRKAIFEKSPKNLCAIETKTL
jgi:hypothetical protein